MKAIAFFGHRNVLNQHEVEKKLKKTLNDVIPSGFSNLLIGCHGDFDKIALSSCLDYKTNTDPNVKISIVLSSMSFLNKSEDGLNKVEFYKRIGCETLFYNIENVYYKNRISFSNKKMIDECDLVICYVDMKAYKSGAKTAINYAIRQNKKIINLFTEN